MQEIKGPRALSVHPEGACAGPTRNVVMIGHRMQAGFGTVGSDYIRCGHRFHTSYRKAMLLPLKMANSSDRQLKKLVWNAVTDSCGP